MPTIINGTNENDTLQGGSENEIINGLAGDDLLIGNEGDDQLNGGEDNDRLQGGQGTDGFDGGTGVDTVEFTLETTGITVDLTKGQAIHAPVNGVSIVETLTGIERVRGTKFDDELIGDAENNLLFGDDGDDKLQGGAGDDWLDGGLGVDYFDGGEGNDRASFRHEQSGVTADLNQGIATHVEADGTTVTETLVSIESLLGSLFDDVLVGDAQDNSLIGEAGNDTISGGEGNDTLDGREGSDVMDGGAGRDTAFFGYSATGVSIDLTQNIATVQTASGPESDTVLNIERVHGSAFDDVMIGDANDNDFIGIGGNDRFSGGAGNDRFFGGLGLDSFDGGAGQDIVYFNEELAGVTVDLTRRFAVVETEDGSLGMESIRNVEILSGSQFDDVFIGDYGDNGLNGNLGNDVLFGGAGNDALNGGEGDDRLHGELGRDRLFGFNGDDVLVGGEGKDYLSGGAGADTFVFEALTIASDTIADFNASQGDQIQIFADGFDSGLAQGTLAESRFVLGSAATNESDRFIYDQSTGVLSFDADGSGAMSAVQVASLGRGTVLSHTSIAIA